MSKLMLSTVTARKVSLPSTAHKRSAFAVIDPIYSSAELIPGLDLANENDAAWLYGEAELECWRLSVLHKRMQTAELKVGYPGKFHTPASHVTFRCEMEVDLALGETINLRAVGDVTVAIGGREIYRGAASNEPHSIVLTDGLAAKAKTLTVDLLSHKGEPPAILIDSGRFATTYATWYWSYDGIHWSIPMPFPQTSSGIPPHRVEPSEVALRPESQRDGLIDFGRELLGCVSFSCSGQPSLYVGESIAEVQSNAPEGLEQSTELLKTGDGQWMSKHPLALRYIRVTAGKAKDVICHALFHPAQYRGAFACSDEVLTQIWMNSAYTLRLCMHDFLIDGIKRDRLPWAGDLALSIMANAYTFADADIVRRSLTVLGRAGISESHINGIIDYSLWWIIAQDFYQLYFADKAHLNREWARVKDALECLEERCDEDGLLLSGPDTWLFIDWVEEDKLTALQILWWWAQISGAALAERMHEDSIARKWRARAEALAPVLHSKAWNDESGGWRGNPEKPSDISRHANLLAIVSGLTRSKSHHGLSIADALSRNALPSVGTPYMKGFECMALSRIGKTPQAISDIRSYWGGMLDRGATTFWEAYNTEEKDDHAYAFYDRPFGKSLCHAWSASPAMILPFALMGIRPTADGWEHFTVACDLGDLTSACASIPTPHGEIRMEVDSDKMMIHVPAGTTLEFRQRSYPGPTRVSIDQPLAGTPFVRTHA